MRFPDPVATVLAKAGSLADLNPLLFAALLATGGVLLIRGSSSKPPAALTGLS